MRERFRAEGLRYIEPELKRPNDPEATRYLDKCLAYAEVEPLCAQGRIDLLDHLQLIRELKCLERRARAGSKPLVDHPTGGYDDHANALALAAVSAMRPKHRWPAGFFERPTITDVIAGAPAPPLPPQSGGIRRVEF